MPRRGLGWLYVAALFVVVPFSILLGMLLSPDRLADLDAAAVPVVEPADTIQFDQRSGVVITPRWAEGTALHAPNWTGIVGRVDLQVGTSLESGVSIGSVAGVTRLAVTTPEPFYRPLALGDRGPDVVWLHDALRRLGHLDAAPSNASLVSATTVRAINALAIALGVPGGANAFDPAWFVWLPQEPYPVASVALVAGAPAPGPGTPVASSARRLVGADLQGVDGGALELDEGVDYVLAVADVEVPLDPGGGLSEDGLAQLGAVLDPAADSASGSVHRAEPLAVWAVPSAAVVSGADGRLCVWVAADDTFEAVAVRVSAARAGLTFVEPPAAEGTRVLHNPAAILADPACPSS